MSTNLIAPSVVALSQPTTILRFKLDYTYEATYFRLQSSLDHGASQDQGNLPCQKSEAAYADINEVLITLTLTLITGRQGSLHTLDDSPKLKLNARQKNVNLS